MKAGGKVSHSYVQLRWPSNLLPAPFRSLHCTREWPRSLRRGRTSRDPQRSKDMKAEEAKKITDQALQNLTD
ncbi:MAG: hypothetical protein AB7Q00_15735, partial [Phycisphaerales bacterium]